MPCIGRLQAALSAALFLCGCQSLMYYGQAVWGHARIVLAEKPITELIDDPSTPAPTKAALKRVSSLRDYAEHELKLPAGGSYRWYADIGRPAAVWNVFAAPEFSLDPKTWCYPVAGCAAYRGYFAQAGAIHCAEGLRAEGYDVFVYGALAYSTLGWFDDPVLSTFLGLDAVGLPALLFHELAHRLLYVPGDTAFNESFATAVENEGLRRWSEAVRNPALFAEYRKRRSLQDEILLRVSRTREALKGLYAAQLPPAQKRMKKEELLADLRSEYLALRRQEPALAVYQNRFGPALNNASLAVFATYNEFVPSFGHLLQTAGGDLESFYTQCRMLAQLPEAERRTRLRQLAAAGVLTGTACYNTIY
jgi:predicted aminopeptidase